MSKLDANHAYKLDTEDELALMRDKFIFKDSTLIYLDGNSLGRLPRATTNHLQNVIEEEWGRRLIRGWGEKWFGLQEEVGAKIAKLIGARPDEVIIADSTSVNLYKLVVAALRAQSGRRKVVTDDLNFPSDLYIIEGAIDLLPNRYTEIVRSEDGIHGPVDGLKNALNDSTALLTLSHTTFKSGYTYDMADLSAAARQHGTLTLWDLSHSVGSVPINLTQSKADLAVGCTYKYLNGGPGAPAFLYVRRELQKSLDNPIAGWFGRKDLFQFDMDYQPDDNIRRFLTGTPPVLSLSAVESGVDLVLEAGMDALRRKSIRQTEYLIDLYDEYLAPLGFRLNSPRDADRRGSHISIGHDEGWRINQALIEDKNVLPDFREPDNLRLGIAPLYTSYSDIYTAVMRLRSILQENLHEKYTQERTAVT